MKIKACLLAVCVLALSTSAAQAWGLPRPGFYFGFYGPPVYGPPLYGPPIYGPPVLVPPPAPAVVVAPPLAYLPPPPPAYYYPRPAVGASIWFR